MKHITNIQILFVFALIAICSFLTPAMVFAEESNVSTVQQISKNTTNHVLNSGGKELKTSDIDGSAYIPDVTIDDANQWVAKKGDDVVGFGSTLAEPISIVGFMVGAFVALLGAATKSKHLVKGLVIMAISVCVYVGVVFAPELVQYFSGWLAS